MTPCPQLNNVPVVGAGQLDVLCPNCKHYFKGTCVNPIRQTATDPCPFGDTMKFVAAQDDSETADEESSHDTSPDRGRSQANGDAKSCQ